MVKRKSEYQWFVEPKGDVAHANSVINNYLHDPAERAMEEMRDKHGNPHNVWQCSHAQAESLRASQATVQAHFNIWNRPHGYGPILFVTHLMPLGKRQKKEKAKKRTFKPHPRGLAKPYAQNPLPF